MDLEFVLPPSLLPKDTVCDETPEEQRPADGEAAPTDGAQTARAESDGAEEGDASPAIAATVEDAPQTEEGQSDPIDVVVASRAKRAIVVAVDEPTNVNKLTAAELRAQLSEAGLSTKGNVASLRRRVAEIASR